MSSLGVDETLLRVGSLVVLGVVLVVSGFVLTRLQSGELEIRSTLENRFVFGVPWGTVILVGLLYAIFYLLQGGGQPGGPIVVGFRSWSLWYPQSILFSSFTHSSHSHLLGNVFGTIAFAPIVEYAWGHYPPGQTNGGTRLRNRSPLASDDQWRETVRKPVARIALFVFATILLGIVGSILVPGAVIGFSGLVFAFAGFALVRYPITTVLAIVGIQVVRLLHGAVTDPIVFARSQEQFVQPSWANIAIQGHLYGLLVGVLLGVALLHYRNVSPDLRHVFFAALVFAVTRSLHSIYWFLGNERYVLFRAVGTAGVLLLATVVAVAVFDGDRLLSARLDLRVRTAALGIVLALVLALAVIGIPYNLVSVSGGEELNGGIEVRDYTVTYEENVDDRYISALDLPFYQGPAVRMSGVIVASDRRNAWERTIPKQQLAAEGSATIVVGDATWRDTVKIRRTEWTLVGGNTTYKVFGEYEGEETRLYRADPARAQPQLNGTRIAIQAMPGRYEITVVNRTVRGVATVPEPGEAVEIDGIRFEREEDTLYAKYERTELLFAEFSG